LILSVTVCPPRFELLSGHSLKSHMIPCAGRIKHLEPAGASTMHQGNRISRSSPLKAGLMAGFRVLEPKHR